MSTLVPVARQRDLVLGDLAALPAQTLPLSAAHGHRLARDVQAALAVPPWDNSAMDGYAVRFADIARAGPQDPVRLQVVADLPAGSALDPPIAPGQATRIMTGAALPGAADTVVQLEHTDRTDPHGPLAETVTVTVAQTEGRHVRYAGEDIGVGDTVARTGARVSATVLASVAAAGHGTVAVHRRARVAVIATGSELVEAGAVLRRGQIPDSNAVMVAGLVAEAGAQVASVATVGDDPAELAAHLDQVAGDADVIVLTGGVSAGAYDPVTRVFADTPEVTFTKVAMQPGKPQAFGRYRDALLFGLPGNPVSVWVSFHVFVRPALLTLQGAPAGSAVPVPVRGTAGVGWPTPPGRDQYIPVRIDPRGEEGMPTVVPAAAHGSKSHLVGSLAAAQGYAIVPANWERVEPGDLLDVVLDPERQS